MLENLKQRITTLISLYEGEKQRADMLERRLSDAEAKVETYSKQITELNRQMDNLKLKSALTSEAGTARAKERIDKLIRDIDKCIAYMES